MQEPRKVWSLTTWWLETIGMCRQTRSFTNQDGFRLCEWRMCIHDNDHITSDSDIIRKFWHNHICLYGWCLRVEAFFMSLKKTQSENKEYKTTTEDLVRWNYMWYKGGFRPTVSTILRWPSRPCICICQLQRMIPLNKQIWKNGVTWETMSFHICMKRPFMQDFKSRLFGVICEL